MKVSCKQMQDLKPTIWAGQSLSVGESHRNKEQVEKNSHVLKNQLKKKFFRCFVAVEQIEKLNSSLLTAMDVLAI